MITQHKKPTNMLPKLFVSVVMFAYSGAILGDDITGEEKFICASANVIVCLADGSCTSALPWEIGVPQFIKIDTKKRSLSTTEASGENRATVVDAVKRIDGRIYLQGVDRGRAYSFVIDEESGLLTAAVAHDDLTVTVFGSCTPTP